LVEEAAAGMIMVAGVEVGECVAALILKMS
jgi:hypothetical protein